MSVIRYPLLGFIVLLHLASCEKKSDVPEVSGRFTEHRSCTVIPPPAGVDIDTFYTSYLNCSGIAVVAPAGVPPEVLYAADSIIAFMLDGLDPVRNEMMRQGVYHVLYPPGMTPNDMPEKLGEGYAYGPGSFIIHKQVSITSMANVMCYPAPDNRSILDAELVHEFGHSVYELGLVHVYEEFDTELWAAYNNAMALGLWDSTQMEGNVPHYFVEGLQIWYGVNKPGPVGGNGNSNNIGTREQLLTHDPMLYQVFNRYLNNRVDVPVCF